MTQTHPEPGLMKARGLTRWRWCWGWPIGDRFRWRIEFKLADFWVGLFWRRSLYEVEDVWLCVIPCFPVHFEREQPHW
jgi:hypothetical protein